MFPACAVAAFYPGRRRAAGTCGLIRVNGTLIEAAASLKSFRAKDGPPPPEDDPDNPRVGAGVIQNLFFRSLLVDPLSQSPFLTLVAKVPFQHSCDSVKAFVVSQHQWRPTLSFDFSINIIMFQQ